MDNKNDQDAFSEVDVQDDFSDFEGQDTADADLDTGEKKKNPLIKLGLIAAAVIAVVGGIVMFGGEEEKQPDSYVGGPSDLKETPGTKEVTPAMREALEDYNDQRIEKAVNEGDSVMPTPIDPPKTFLPVPTDTTTNDDPLQRWRQMQEERLRVQREQEQMQTMQEEPEDPQEQQARDAMVGSMQAAMQQIVSEEKDGLMKTMAISSPPEEQGGAVGGMGGIPGQPGTGDPTAQQLKPKTIVIPAGTILYAQLLNEANSDVPGPLIALLAQGKFSGSKVLGSFAKQKELLVLEFKTLVTKEGYSVPINAIAMDPDNTLTAMATEVDHRYWERVILPAAAKFVQGVGEAIAESGTTTVNVNSGDGSTTSTTDNSEIDIEQEISEGVAKAFETVGEVLTEEGDDTEILVIVHAGTPMGILFIESLTQEDIDQARYGVSMSQQQQQQQQQGAPFGYGSPVYNIFGMPQNGQQPMGMMGLPAAVTQGLQMQEQMQSGQTSTQPGTN